MSSLDHGDCCGRAAEAPKATALRAVAHTLLRKPSAMQVALALLAIAGAGASIAAAPGLPGLLGAGLLLCMLAIAAVDAREFIIPNELVAVAFGLGLVQAAVTPSEGALWGIAAAAFRAAGMVLVFALGRAAYYRLRGRQGLGWGDIKLMAVAGAWLDWPMIAYAVETAALSAIALYLWRQWSLGRAPRFASRMPFGLFLAPAIWLCWLIDAVLQGWF